MAAFLGDSYTSGYNGAGYGRFGWPAIVSASLKLSPLNRAVPGTGYVNPGWTGLPIRTQLAAVIRANPRILFLAAGHNDRRYAPAGVRTAAADVIGRLHRALPRTTLVVVGPIWSGDVAPPSLRQLRDALRRQARAIGAVFIDPIAGGWLAGPAAGFIGPDGLHPTDAGHRHIAGLVLAALHAASPSSSRQWRATGIGQPGTMAPSESIVSAAPQVQVPPMVCAF